MARENRIKPDKSDVVMNRISVSLVCAFLGVAAVFALDRMRSSLMIRYYYPTFYALTAIAAAIAALSVFRMIKNRKTGTSEKLKSLTSQGMLLMSLVMLFSLAVIHVFPLQSFKFLYVFIPVATGLYMVFLLYQREFFHVCLFASAFGLAFWVCYSMGDLSGKRLAIAVAGLLVMFAASAAYALALKLGRGCLRFMGRSYAVMPKGASYVPVMATLAAAAAGCAAFVGIGPKGAFYAALAMPLIVFAFGVYYTIRMMME